MKIVGGGKNPLQISRMGIFLLEEAGNFCEVLFIC